MSNSASLLQANSAAIAVQPTVPVLAPFSVVEPIAIADIEGVLAAIAPDRELHEPRKSLRERAIELASVDATGHQANDVGTAAWPVTVCAIGMSRLEPLQDAGAV